MSRRARASVGWLFVLAAVGCEVLPEIKAGVCGNSVIDGSESCDRFPVGETECRPPGAADQCQLDCSLRSDGSRPACPDGWGCDERDVCRSTTGAYRAFGAPLPGNAESLIAGDFDGDGRADVLTAEAPGAFGATKFRVHYFDRSGALTSSWLSSRTIMSLAVGRVSEDVRSDVVFTDERIGVLLGQPDRTLIGETYATYRLRERGVRIAGPLHADVIEETPSLLVVADDAGEIAIKHPDMSTASLALHARQPGHIADLAGDPVSGDVFAADSDDPCLDTVVAVRGQHEARVYSVCQPGPTPQSVRWRSEARVRSVALPPEAAIDRGPLLCDLDGDGHLDLLLGSGDQAYVAYGNGLELETPQPVMASIDGELQPLPMPLAAADWNGDARADLVYPVGFAASQPTQGRALVYRGFSLRFASSWTAARIMDLNADGHPDVVAASDNKLDIDFFNGTGGDALNGFVIPTERPVEQLTIGDFDGDLVQDLAFTQRGPEGAPGDVMVAFGARSGPPISQVTAARVADIQQIGAFPHSGPEAVADLFVAYTQADEQGEQGAALAWLTGFDRSLTCLVELTTFDANGGIESVPALNIALGAFRAPGQPDALMVAPGKGVQHNALWSLTNLATRTARPRLLDWPFDAELSPVRGATQVLDVQLLTAAGDLDGDGTDELVVAAPPLEGEGCYVASAQLAADGASASQRGELARLDLPCGSSGQLAVADLNGDGAGEVLLLSGTPDGERRLVALWNDGGELSPEPVDLALPGDEPRAFVLYRPTPKSRLRLAYVTADALRVLEVMPGTRELHKLLVWPDLELARPTGIAAGDLDGDGVVDLMLADDGSLLLLHAELSR